MAPRRKPGRESSSWRNSWEESERQFLEVFETATVVPTIWACPHTMDLMGIEQDVEFLLRDMGLGNLHYFRYPVYKEPTIHFFSSMQMNWQRGREMRDLRLTFRIRGEHYSMTLVEICDALGIPTGTRTNYIPLKRPDQFWPAVATGDYDSADARNVNIRNPAIRYTMRLLANTYFARRDTRKVKSSELSLLYRALREKLDLEELFRGTPDNACVFLADLIRLRSRLSKTMGNVLNFGGMLTPIFTYLNINLRDFTANEELHTMNLGYVRAAKFCPRNDWEGSGYVHNFLVGELRLSCNLPRPEIVDVTIVDNIRFFPPDEFCFPSPDDLPEPRRRTRIDPVPAPDLDEDDEEEGSRNSDEQPPLPPLSPDASKKKKKWYEFHKYGGKAIKELFKKWGETSASVKELKLEVDKLRDDMRYMSVHQSPPAQTPDPPTELHRSGSSGRELTRTFERRRRQPPRHSTGSEGPREPPSKKKGKEPLVEETRGQRRSQEPGDDVDFAALRHFDDSPHSYYGGSSRRP